VALLFVQLTYGAFMAASRRYFRSNLADDKWLIMPGNLLEHSFLKRQTQRNIGAPHTGVSITYCSYRWFFAARKSVLQ